MVFFSGKRIFISLFISLRKENGPAGQRSGFQVGLASAFRRISGLTMCDSWLFFCKKDCLLTPPKWSSNLISVVAFLFCFLLLTLKPNQQASELAAFDQEPAREGFVRQSFQVVKELS